jgi:hypothetical protein
MNLQAKKGTAYTPGGGNEEIVEDHNPQCVKFSGKKMITCYHDNMITIS